MLGRKYKYYKENEDVVIDANIEICLELNEEKTNYTFVSLFCLQPVGIYNER